jgi:hypothetical protein
LRLGFADGYVRAFEGSPDDPWVVVIHEIRVSPPSILRAPERGRVTPAMVRRVGTVPNWLSIPCLRIGAL